MIKFDVITLFPQLFKPHLQNLPFKKAIEKNLLKIDLHNLRDFAVDERGTVDDRPYGGGPGMILMAEPIVKALENIFGNESIAPPASATGAPLTDNAARLQHSDELDYDEQAPSARKNKKVILLSPRGQKFTQKKARELSEREHIALICGRYEGVDARIEENYVDEIISIGDYVVSGGELPALIVMEAVTRLLPGVLEKAEASKLESFSNGAVDHPQYTRPEDFKGIKVPEILLSGNHAEIEKWKEKHRKPPIYRA